MMRKTFTPDSERQFDQKIRRLVKEGRLLDIGFSVPLEMNVKFGKRGIEVPSKPKD